MPSTNSSARSWTPQSRMRQSDNSIKQFGGYLARYAKLVSSAAEGAVLK